MFKHIQNRFDSECSGDAFFCVVLSNVRNTYAAACMSCIGKIAIDKLVNQFLPFSTYDVPPTLLDADPPVSHSHGMFCFAFLAVMKF